MWIGKKCQEAESRIVREGFFGARARSQIHVFLFHAKNVHIWKEYAESTLRWCFSPYQVGVKAPGNPMRITFLPLVCSSTLIFSGSNFEKSSRSPLSCVGAMIKLMNFYEQMDWKSIFFCVSLCFSTTQEWDCTKSSR